MLAIGCDHGGLALKNAVKEYLDQKGILYKDFGTFTEESVDYAPIAAQVGRAVVSGGYEKGLLFCGTGVGISIAANKVKGVRAACCSEAYSAEYTRRHNDANILCLGGRVISKEQAIKLVQLFLDTPFEGGRHARRIAQIAAIENGEL